MTLEQYFRRAIDSTIDYELRVNVVDGKVVFYIHPADKAGLTLDFSVKGNKLTEIV